jgi:ATP-dependent DNA ligase
MPRQATGGNPGFIAPMLATAAAGLPADAVEFVAEVKWDVLRACVAAAGGRVRAWSRGGRDITAVYPELGALAAGFAAGGPRGCAGREAACSQSGARKVRPG